MPRDRLSALPSSGPPWDTLLQVLDLPDLKNLRLCSKQLSQACIHHRFLSFIGEDQTTDLGSESLRSLAELTMHPLGRSVKNLTIVAPVYNTSRVEELLKFPTVMVSPSAANNWTFGERRATEMKRSAWSDELAWLEERKREQKEGREDSNMIDSLARVLQNLNGGAAESIRLEAPIISRRRKSDQRWLDTQDLRFQPWRDTWRHAARVCQLTLLAIVRSKARVNRLTIYRDTPRCGISPRDILTTVTQVRQEAGDGSLGAIHELAISIGFGSEYEPDPARDDSDTQAEHSGSEPDNDAVAAANAAVDMEHDLTNYNAARELAKTINTLMPNLASLDLRFYLALTDTRLRRRSEEFFQTIAGGIHLSSSLQRCTLRGIRSTRDSLMKFLTNHPGIQHLELTNFSFQGDDTDDGGGTEAIRTLIKTLPSLQTLSLSDIFERGGRHMNLYPVGNPPLQGEEDVVVAVREKQEGYDHLAVTPGTTTRGRRRSWKMEGFSRMSGRHIHTIHLEGDDLTPDIQFRRPPTGWQMGSAEFANWMSMRRREYEPYSS